MRLTPDLSRSRVEIKYSVAAEDVPALADRILADEREEYLLRTLYFDRPDGSLARRAVEDPFHCTKVRSREYGEDSSVWFEVKTRRGRWTRKSRLHLHRAEAEKLLGGEGGEVELGGVEEEAEARRFLQGVARGELVPIGTVIAHRQTFGMKRPRVRITLDREIVYFRPSGPPYASPGWKASARLLRREREPVLEVKHAGHLPAWCEELVAGLRNTTYSKFRTLVQSLADGGKAAGHVDRL